MSETITTVPAAPPVGRIEPTFTRHLDDLVDRHKADTTAAQSAAAKAVRERDALQARFDAVAAENAAALTAAETRANERVIRSELRAVAVKAGLVDASDLAMLDVSKVKLTGAGDVDGAAAVIAAFKAAKPHLFGSNTTKAAGEPPKVGDKVKLAKDMTDEEYRAARAEAIRRK